MERRKSGPKGPFKKIDWDIFEGLCAIQCNAVECAVALKISLSKLKEDVKKEYGYTFEVVRTSFRGKGNIPVRRKIYQKCLAGDNQMLKLWAENYLDCSEKNQTTVNISGDIHLNKAKRITDLLTGSPEEVELQRKLIEITAAKAHEEDESQ